MDVGKRSLSNSQTALQTVSHNIANKSTEGYSRQRVDLVANEPIGSGNIRIGMGARATRGAVSRTDPPTGHVAAQRSESRRYERTRSGVAPRRARRAALASRLRA